MSKDLTKMCNKSTSECISLAKQLKETQDKIDKAIEYINENIPFMVSRSNRFKEELLKILKGEEDE